MQQGLEGTTLGRYYLEQRLGQGGMSEVYLAHDERMNRRVAIKVVSGTHTGYLERFQREAEAIGRLYHDHVLPAYDYGDEQPWHYLVMPYIEYGTLRDLIAEGPLSLEDAGEMLEQIASALQFAHDNGIVHRDIKPSNILLRDRHHAYLADFGLAKELEGGSTLTQVGALLGTPEYMAPDLAEGPATTSSDIYALGILLYQMLTGYLPFTGETPIAVYWKQIRDQPPPPSSLNPAIPPAIDRVVLHALEKDPRHRFKRAIGLSRAYNHAVQTLQMPNHSEVMETPLYEPVLEQQSAEQYSYGQPAPATPVSPVTTPTQRYRAFRRRRASTASNRLILPGNPLISPTTARRRRRAPARTDEPERPPRTTDYEPQNPATPAATYPTPRHLRQRHSRGGTALVVSVVAIGFLLIVVLPISLIYYISATAHHGVPSPGGQTSQQAQPTATATVSVINRAPVLTDKLTGNTNGRWAEDATNCVFTNGAYHINVRQSNFQQPCPLLSSPITNAAIQVDISLLSGQSAGMLLRVNGEQFYDFEMNDQGQFFFRRHDAGGGMNYTYLIPATASNAISTGSQKNTLLIIANGNDFKLYINNIFAGETHDNRYVFGQFALVAGTTAPIAIGESSFTNFKLYDVR